MSAGSTIQHDIMFSVHTQETHRDAQKRQRKRGSDLDSLNLVPSCARGRFLCQQSVEADVECCRQAGTHRHTCIDIQIPAPSRLQVAGKYNARARGELFVESDLLCVCPM